MLKLELCFKCGEPTGKAGRSDDSIYDDNGLGPYCEECRKSNLDVFEEYASEHEGETA